MNADREGREFPSGSSPTIFCIPGLSVERNNNYFILVCRMVVEQRPLHDPPKTFDEQLPIEKNEQVLGALNWKNTEAEAKIKMKNMRTKY